MASFGEIFNLRAVVEIVTGSAEKKIDQVAKQGQAAASQLDLLTKAAQSAGGGLTGLGASGAAMGGLLKSAFSVASAQALKFAGGAVLGVVASTLTAIGTTALMMGQQFHDSSKRIQAALGETEEGARKLSQQMSRIWTSGVDDVVSIEQALTGVRRHWSDLGDETERVSKLMLDFARVNKSDVGASIKDTASLLRAYKLDFENLPKVLDVVTAVSQKTGAPAQELLKQLPQARTYTAPLGTSLQEDAAMVGTLIQTGGDVGAIRGGLQTLGEASTAPTAEQVSAFKNLGVAVNGLGQPVGGLTSAWNQLTKAAREGKVETAAAQTSFMKLLGEDDSAQILTAMRVVGSGYADLVKNVTENTGQLENASDTLKETFGEGVTTLFRETAGAAGASVGGLLAGPASDLIQWTIDLVRAGKDLGERAFGDFVDWIKASFPDLVKSWDILRPVLDDTWTWITEGFQGLQVTVGAALEALVDHVSSALAPVLDVLDPVLATVTTILAGILRTLNTVIDGVARIGAAFGAASVPISQGWDQAVDGMRIVWESFADGVKEVWADALKFVLSGLEALPQRAQKALGANSLRQTIDGLETRHRPQKSALEGLQKIVSAPLNLGGMGNAILDAWQAQDRARQEKPAPKPSPEPQMGKALGVATDKGPTGPTAEEMANRRKLRAEQIKDATEAVSRELSLNKISEAAAIKKYQAILLAARASALGAKDLYAVEKALHDLQTDISGRVADNAEKEQKAREQAREKAREATERTRVERLTLVKGETEGLLAQLDIEKRERLKAGADAVEVEAWASAERIKIMAAEAETRKEKVDEQAELLKKRGQAESDLVQAKKQAEQEGLAAQDRTLAAALAGLDKQLDEQKRALEDSKNALIDAGGDKLQAEKLYQDAVLAADRSHQAQRLKLQQDDAKARLKVEQDLQKDILRARAAAEDDPKKAAKLGKEAERAEKLQSIKDKVDAARKQGVDESVIQKFVKAESAAVLAGERTEESANTDEGARAEQAGGFRFGSFGTNVRKRKPVEKEDKQMARDISALGFATPASPKPKSNSVGSGVGSLFGIDSMFRGDPVASKAVARLGAAGQSNPATGSNPRTESLSTVNVDSTLTIRMVEDRTGKETFKGFARGGHPSLFSTTYNLTSFT